MGQSARVAAKDYWGHFQPLVDHINATGQTLISHDLPLFLDRHGFLEETFFSFQFIPILNDTGQISGYYQPLIETTKSDFLVELLKHKTNDFLGTISSSAECQAWSRLQLKRRRLGTWILIGSLS